METTKSSKRKRIVYWIFTIWMSLGFASTGIVQLMRLPEEVENFARLGYPPYFLTIIGAWKLLGVIAVLVPGFTVLKEWAYAGFIFVTTGALFSHLAIANPMSEVFPSLLLLTLTIISWYFRPDSRRVAPARNIMTA